MPSETTNSQAIEPVGIPATTAADTEANEAAEKEAEEKKAEKKEA